MVIADVESCFNALVCRIEFPSLSVRERQRQPSRAMRNAPASVLLSREFIRSSRFNVYSHYPAIFFDVEMNLKSPYKLYSKAEYT